jgi:hypothetical protein
VKHGLRAHRDRRSAEIMQDREGVLAAREHLAWFEPSTPTIKI